MEQIIVQIHSREKAKMLLELLAALDFVYSVKTSSAETEAATQEEPLDDFFCTGWPLAGQGYQPRLRSGKKHVLMGTLKNWCFRQLLLYNCLIIRLRFR